MYWMSAERVICASHEYPVRAPAEGPARPLHGHNWRIIAHICAEQLDASGRVLAPELLEAELWRVVEPLDHRHLNDLGEFSEAGGSPPTAAGIARLVGERLATRLNDDRVRVRRIEVEPRVGLRTAWESP